MTAAQPAASLSFSGFTAGMPMPEARARISQAASGSLSCRTTIDWRMRDCTGRVQPAPSEAPFNVLISSIHDSAAVIVLSLRGTDRAASRWVASLTATFGVPELRKHPDGSARWQWVRARKMLRVVERRSGGGWETSVTLTHGPLLDGLGPIETKRPGMEARPSPATPAARG